MQGLLRSAAFYEICKFVKQSCHDDLKLSFQLPLYGIHLRVENNSRLLSSLFFVFCHYTKRLAPKKFGSLCYPIRSKKTKPISTRSQNFSRNSLWQDVHSCIEFWLVQCIVCDFCDLLWVCFDGTQLTTILWTVLVIYYCFKRKRSPKNRKLCCFKLSTDIGRLRL